MSDLVQKVHQLRGTKAHVVFLGVREESDFLRRSPSGGEAHGHVRRSGLVCV